MMILSKTAEEELRERAHSSCFKYDMTRLAESRHNPFIKESKVDVDAYISFVSEFNEFINHQRKPFAQIIDKDMRL